jgi:hypothetical protein
MLNKCIANAPSLLQKHSNGLSNPSLYLLIKEEVREDLYMQAGLQVTYLLYPAARMHIILLAAYTTFLTAMAFTWHTQLLACL